MIFFKENMIELEEVLDTKNVHIMRTGSQDSDVLSWIGLYS